VEWTENIKDIDINMEEIGERYKDIVNKIGIENFIYLTKEAGGGNCYVPKMDSFLKNTRNRKIAEEYNGYNVKQLSKKYNLSARWVREIIKKVKKIEE